MYDRQSFQLQLLCSHFIFSLKLRPIINFSRYHVSLIWNVSFIKCDEMFSLTLNNSLAKDRVSLIKSKKLLHLSKSLYEQS